jgi:hypothetical protein
MEVNYRYSEINMEGEITTSDKKINLDQVKPQFPNQLVQLVLDNLWQERMALIDYIKNNNESGIDKQWILKIQSKVNDGLSELDSVKDYIDDVKEYMNNASEMIGEKYGY